MTNEEILKASTSANLFGPVLTNSVVGIAAAPSTTGANGVGNINGKPQRENAPSPPPSPGTNGNAPIESIPLHTKADGVSSPSSKADVIRFVHQLCLMGKNVQIPTRLALYRALVERGLLFALEWALRVPLPSSSASSQATATSTPVNGTTPIPSQSHTQTRDPSDPDPPLLDMVAEVFILVAEFNIAGVRAHVVRQNEASRARDEEEQRARAGEPIPASGKPVNSSSGVGGRKNKAGEASHLLKALTARLGGTKEQPFRNQIGDAIRLLLESPPSMDFHAAGDVCNVFIPIFLSDSASKGLVHYILRICSNFLICYRQKGTHLSNSARIQLTSISSLYFTTLL